MRIIKNVIRVEYVATMNMGAILVRNNQEVKILDDGIPFAEVCIKVPANCSVSSKMDAGQKIYTTNLQFSTAETLPEGFLAFRVTTADGEQYLVGCRRRPYPVTTSAKQFPDSFGQSSLNLYNVTWEALNGALLII